MNDSSFVSHAASSVGKMPVGLLVDGPSRPSQRHQAMSHASAPYGSSQPPSRVGSNLVDSSWRGSPETDLVQRDDPISGYLRAQELIKTLASRADQYQDAVCQARQERQARKREARVFGAERRSLRRRLRRANIRLFRHAVLNKGGNSRPRRLRTQTQAPTETLKQRTSAGLTSGPMTALSNATEDGGVRGAEDSKTPVQRRTDGAAHSSVVAATARVKSLESLVRTLELEVETLRASNRIKDEAIARLEDAARGARQALVNIQRDLGASQTQLHDLAKASSAQIGTVKAQAQKSISDLAHSCNAALAEARAQIADARAKEKEWRDKYHEAEWLAKQAVVEQEKRRRMQHELLELRGNILVHCRIRKVLPMDVVDSGSAAGPKLALTDLQTHALVHAADIESLVVHMPDAQRRSALGTSQLGPKRFEFDRVYGPDADQDSVFLDCAPYVSAALEGYNCCIMAYGQTGSGKTFTCMGEKDEEGIVPRAARELFQFIAARRGKITYKVTVSVLEIYQDKITDLLEDKSTAGRLKHEIAMANINGKQTVQVSNLLEREVTDLEGLLRLIREGMRRRTSDATLIHEHSSRSHCVVTLNMLATAHITGISTHSKMHFVDLAGSESVAMSGVTGNALAETKNINKSLSALADVLKALAEKQKHVPYRNSKLTYMLSDSIGGDAKMILLVCVSPTQKYITETLQSLQFALRARKVEKGKAKINRA